MGPYVSITTNEEFQQLFVAHMWVLRGMQNANGYYGTYMRVLQWMQNAYNYFKTYMRILHIWKFPYGIYNRKWCRYYMFKMCVLF
jgi:hypothetical protein